MKNRLKRIVLRLSESSKFSQTHKIFYPFPAKLTLQRSQHSPEAHWASTFSLHVIPSQQLSCSHSSRLPQSHSSSSSMILLPQLRRISSCVRGAVTERAKWNENEGFVCVISRSQTRMIRGTCGSFYWRQLGTAYGRPYEKVFIVSSTKRLFSKICMLRLR